MLQAGAYGARLERVVAARAAVEQRLHKRLDLLDGYARVVNMIEIEVRRRTGFTGLGPGTGSTYKLIWVFLEKNNFHLY